MTAELDLGFLELESRTCGHRVHVHSTANFAASGKDETELQVLLTRPRLTASKEQPPWIRAGANLTLALTVQIANVLSASATREVIESLSARLMHAKLWDQLGFARPSMQTSTDVDSYRIELRLKYEPNAGEDSKKTIHKLGGHVPFYDVRPPAEIVQVVFENAHLHIRVTGPRHPLQASTPKRELRRAENRSSRPSNEPPFQLSIDRETEILFDEVCGENSMEDEMGVYGMINDNDDHDESQMLFSQSELYEDGDSSFLSGCTYPKPRYRTSHDPDIECKDFDQDVAHVTDLIEMSITIAVLGPRKRRKRPSKLSCKDLRPLSFVAPSVWLPGYLPSLADRSVFFPTIAHALTSVLGKTAPSIQKHGHLDTAASFRRHLWRTSEKVTYNLQAGKPTKDAFSSGQADSVEFKFTDDILESSQESILRLYGGEGDEEDPFDFASKDEIRGMWPDEGPFGIWDFHTEMNSDIGPDSQLLRERDDLFGNECVDDATHSMAGVDAYSSTRTATYAVNSANKPAAAFEDDILSVSSDTDMLPDGARDCFGRCGFAMTRSVPSKVST